MRYRNRHAPSANGGYRQNYGKPGVVYILSNDAFAVNFYKIGCSTRSGSARAIDLNKDANTGTPALFKCEFETRTIDCGLAEQRVFSELASYRTGKTGQEYFKVDLNRAKEAVERVCAQVDREHHVHSTHRPTEPIEVTVPHSQIREIQPVKSVAPAVNAASSKQLKIDRPYAQDKKHSNASKSHFYLWVIFFLCASVLFASLSTETKQAPTQNLTQAVNTISNVSPNPSSPLIQDILEEERPHQLPHLTDQGGEEAAIAALKEYARQTGGHGSTSSANEVGVTEKKSKAQERKNKAEHSSSAAQKPEEMDRRIVVAQIPDLTREEKQSLESVCSSAKYNLGPAAYNDCLNNHLKKFDPSNRPQRLDSLTPDEQRSLESACSSPKYTGGPTLYNECLKSKIAQFDVTRRPKGVKALTTDERRSLESACSTAKYIDGPAAYNDCLNRQLAQFDVTKRPSSVDALTREELSSLESACSTAKYIDGPAAYNACLNKQLAQFDSNKRPLGIER